MLWNGRGVSIPLGGPRKAAARIWPCGAGTASKRHQEKSRFWKPVSAPARISFANMFFGKTASGKPG